MPERPVIVNNTPLVALWSVNRLALLRDLYEEILIPQAVHDEFLAAERSLREEILRHSSWINVTPLENPMQALAYIGLDRGEAEVLALANEQSARLVIIDERRGRRYAKRLGLPLTGTLGVLLAAKDAGLVSRVKPLIVELVRKGLFIEQELIANVLISAGEQE